MKSACLPRVALWVSSVAILAAGCSDSGSKPPPAAATPTGATTRARPSAPPRAAATASGVRPEQAMAEAGYRFTELYFAGGDGNWQYADYQAEKMAQALRLAVDRDDQRAEAARVLFDVALPEVLEAIEDQASGEFDRGMDRLRDACMDCHEATGVGYMKVEMPEHRLAPLRGRP